MVTADVTVIVDDREVWRESVTVGDINGPPWTAEQTQRAFEREAWDAAVEAGAAKVEDRPRARFQVQ